MVMKNKLSFIVKFCFAILVVSFAPACVKYHKTLPAEFPQGDKKKDYKALTNLYVKSAKVYDQFSTMALFDALWLSDDVRMTYSEMHCKKRGISDDDTEAFIARQYEENNHWIMFYVLADVRDRQKTSLSDKNAKWTFYLKIDSLIISPVSVKEVELAPEYQALFGKHYNGFKTAYVVKFPRRSQIDEIKDKEAPINLVIESVNKSVTLSWPANLQLDENKKVFDHEDFYWG